MITFPHAKVNLGLSIISKRTDGFHDLETVFYPINIFDVLEIVPGKKDELTISGLEVQGNLPDNLILKACHKLRSLYPRIPKLEIHLHKVIPMGAGLGGGSSDAAKTIQMLNTMFELGINNERVLEIALALGSDCPFFVNSQPAFATGRGEKLQPVLLDLSSYSFVLIQPEVTIQTSWAFSNILPSPAAFDLRKEIISPVTHWKGRVTNDFEKIVFAKFPALALIKDGLYAAGAVYASMTGSGSALYGIFQKGKFPAVDFERCRTIFIH